MASPIGLGGGSGAPAFEAGVFARRMERPGKPQETLSTAPQEARSASLRPHRVEPAAEIGKQGLERRSGLLSPDLLRLVQEAEAAPETAAAAGAQALTAEEEAEVREFKRTDSEIRAHERSHAAAGGQHAGAPSYSFETGPDGNRYVIAGEVPIDVSPVGGDPEATIRKMEQVKAAAMAPSEPSNQDRAVAAKAEALRSQARAELHSLGAEAARPKAPGSHLNLVV